MKPGRLLGRPGEAVDARADPLDEGNFLSRQPTTVAGDARGRKQPLLGIELRPARRGRIGEGERADVEQRAVRTGRTGSEARRSCPVRPREAAAERLGAIRPEPAVLDPFESKESPGLSPTSLARSRHARDP